MNKNDLTDYKRDFLREYPEPRTLELHRGTWFANGENTSDRKAFRRIDWIDYYRSFVDPEATVFQCAGCGADISCDDDIIDINENVNKAFGGHILIGTTQKIDYYIAPLCPKCNNPAKEIIKIPSDTIAVEEVGQTIISKSETDK